MATESETDRARGATREDDVRAVLSQVYSAWAENDSDAFVAPYAEEATALLPGTYLRSKEEIRATMAALFAGELKGSRGVYEVESVRFPTPSVAIVISGAALLLAGQSDPDPANQTLNSWVLAEDGGVWRVQAFHSCPANQS